MIDIDLTNKVHLHNCLTFMEKLPDSCIDLIFTDTPYNLGTEYIIDELGHYLIVGKGSDFGNKWDVMDGYWWNKFFNEVNRILKVGGYFVTFNIDRHSDLWSHYGRRNGLTPQQKLYWLFLDNFPKAYDVSKALDRDAGCEREVVGGSKGAKINRDKSVLKGLGNDYTITAPASDLAVKYDGYKYSIAPFKQVMEEILVMNKRPIQKSTAVAMVKDYESSSYLKKEFHPPVMRINKPYNPNKPPEKYAPQLFVQSGMGESLIEALGNEVGSKFIELIPEIEYTDLDYTYFYKSKMKDRNTVESDTMHVTVKPLALCERILEIFMLPDKEDMMVYDPFSGSGTIPQACKNNNISFIGTELDPDYHKLAVRRLKETQQTLF